MQVRRPHTTPYRHSSSAVSVVTSLCLISVFALSLVYNLLSNPVGAIRETSETRLAHQQAPGQPLDVPLGTDSNPIETQDEKDSKESLDDEWGKATLACVISSNLPGHWAKFSLTQHIRSTHHRSTVSLVVLHHAWKIFIC